MENTTKSTTKRGRALEQENQNSAESNDRSSAKRMSQEVKLTLSVAINKEKTKVLFAEVDNHFADVLLSFLTLPLGKIVSLLEKHYGDDVPVIGSLNNLRNGLANLNDVHFWTKEGKKMMLNPISSYEAECRKLKLNIDPDTQPAEYFTCEDWNCVWDRSENVSMYYDTLICNCGKSMNKRIRQSAPHGDSGVFTIATDSFLITDDLKMEPHGIRMQALRNLGVTDTNGAELKIVTVGFSEIMHLLKGALLSSTLLTDLILDKRQQMDYATSKSETLLMKKEETSNSKKMIVKALIQKSTNKILIVLSDEKFVDFLFSLLTIPLGGVVCLLDGSTSLSECG